LKYRLYIKPSALKELKNLPRKEQTKADKRIMALAENPRPATATRLKGHPLMRIRIGDYRIVYEINDAVKSIQVVTVGHRSNIYRKI